VRIEAAVLVDHDHAGERTRGIARADQIRLHLAGSALKRDRFGPQARVVGRHDRGLGVVGLEHGQQRGCRGGAAGHRGQAVHEDAAVEPLVGVGVVQVDDVLAHDVSLGSGAVAAPPRSGDEQGRHRALV
jgi:hypothetical protein